MRNPQRVKRGYSPPKRLKKASNPKKGGKSPPNIYPPRGSLTETHMGKVSPKGPKIRGRERVNPTPSGDTPSKRGKENGTFGWRGLSKKEGNLRGNQ